MDETLSGNIFGKFVFAVFVLAVFDLVFINWWILNKGDKQLPQLNSAVPVNIKSSPTPTISTSSPSPEPSTTTTRSLESTKMPVASPSPTPPIIVQTPYKEIFIPLGSGQTKSTDFVDLSGVEINLDLSKYPAIDYAVFEASLWTDGGNGRAWAELKNVTDNNPLIESRVTNPTSTSTLVTSNYVPLATGSKLYRVIAKSDDPNAAAHVENAHIKIVLK